MASEKEYSEPEVVEDDTPAVEEEQGVDAQREDDAVANEPESKQVQNELGDLDQNVRSAASRPVRLPNY